MLAFMRKHQKYFFAVITFVIVVSFSFFGTYQSLSGNSIHDQTAFITVTGKKVSRLELEELVLFLSTDSHDKMIFGGIWGPNFLNDGVIKKDFLETGLALPLIEAYQKDLEEDWNFRLVKESKYQPYVHPTAKFISTQNVWNYFSPDLAKNLKALQASKDPFEPEAVKSRVHLYLAERNFPAPYLRHFLLLQERQMSQILHDETLDYLDHSLFGYHTLEDWFGPRFIRLIAQFILNAASLAEEKGYEVSKEEASVSLLENAKMSFNDNKSVVGLNNPFEYQEQQLMRMRLDKTKAIKIWQKVLLFRHLFNDIGQAVFVDTLPYKVFNDYASHLVLGDLFRLPPPLRFSDFHSLQHFEIYLDAVSKRSKEERSQLSLPTRFLEAQQIAKKYPELVQKKYKLELASFNQDNLLAQITMKETLNWEGDENNWKTLKIQFPQLGLLAPNNQEERLNILDRMDARERAQVDQYARKQLLLAHPIWIKEALAKIPYKSVNVSLSIKGGSPFFPGLKKGDDLIKILDNAKIGEEEETLNALTFDGENYFKIKVSERSPDFEIMTFEEAKPILDDLLLKALEIHYVQLRSQEPERYQKEGKEWKPLKEVRDQVALSYFSKQLDSIKKYLKSLNQELYKNIESEHLAAYRFISYGEETLHALQKDPSRILDLVHEKGDGKNVESQFKWEKTPLYLSRKNKENLENTEKLFLLSPNSWSQVNFSRNGDIYFAYVKEHSKEDLTELEYDQVARARFLLGNEAKVAYLSSLLPILKEKKAISFNYLFANETSIEPEEG